MDQANINIKRRTIMQTVSSAFESQVNATKRYPRQNLKIAWERTQNVGTAYAVVGTSQVDGDDIVQGELTIITPIDLFEFTDETENLVHFVWERRVVEPLSGLAYATGEVLLNNVSKRFSPGYDGSIGSYILPKRPVKLYAGFYFGGIEKTIPVLYGLTDQFKEDKAGRTTQFGIFDYISYIDEFQLETSIYEDKRSDEIISDILENQVGFSTSQFSLDTGLNTIGFAWFEKGTKAGDAIRKICEAEEGYFYQDELGMIRFENRRHYNASPHTSVQWTVEAVDIVDWKEDETIQIINRCNVIARPREVKNNVEIWRSAEVVELEHAEQKDVWADFEDPCSTITSPVATLDYTANTESDGTGIDKTSEISIATSKFTKSAKLRVTNSSGGKLYITLLRLRGNPAIVTGEISEIFEDTDSQDKYGVNELVVENDFIDDSNFAYYLAITMVKKYGTPLRRVNLTVRNIPQLQLKDRIKVRDFDNDEYVEYRIMGIKGTISEQGFLQELVLREISDLEADTPAIVGTSKVDSEDVVWI